MHMVTHEIGWRCTNRGILFSNSLTIQKYTLESDLPCQVCNVSSKYSVNDSSLYMSSVILKIDTEVKCQHEQGFGRHKVHLRTACIVSNMSWYVPRVNSRNCSNFYTFNICLIGPLFVSWDQGRCSVIRYTSCSLSRPSFGFHHPRRGL